MSGRIRSIRFKDGYTADSLTNALTGQGTRFDPRTANAYACRTLSPYEIAAAYDGSGMMAKVIDIPALDMVREWRNWQGDADQIKKLEAEERRLDIRGKIKLAEVYRGLGGGAFIIGVPGDTQSPAPAIGKGGIAYIHVVSRFQLSIGDIVSDYTDPRFGGPEYFEMATNQGSVKFHPCRVICFRGDPVPALIGTNWIDQFWGKSRVARVLEAVQNSDSAQGAFASLITKVRNVIIGIPGLMDLVSDADGERALAKRMSAMMLGESMFNATLRDAGDGSSGAGETIDHRQVNWAGIPDVMMAFATFISAVSDIPATRLLGKSPDGMNATGDGDTHNWNRTVKAKQTLELGPCVDQLDKFLIPSALGSPADICYEWAPLDTPSEKELADTFKATMEAIQIVQNTGAIPDQAFAKGVQNMLVEGAFIPGLEAALEEIPENERFGLNAEPDGTDPSSMQATGTKNGGKEADPNLAGQGGKSGSDKPARRAANDARFMDATPRTLYVQRKLLNANELIRWAKDQGFDKTVPADEMHVTITYSKTPVDWMKMGATWEGGDNGEITVQPGGARIVEPLGDKGAVVLLFASSSLSWRHEEMVRAGASHDFPEYQPHITITYARPEGVDLSKVEPFRGALKFGAEIFEELNEDWSQGIVEDQRP